MSDRSNHDSGNARGRYDYDDYYDTYELQATNDDNLATSFRRLTNSCWLLACSHWPQLLPTTHLLIASYWHIVIIVLVVLLRAIVLVAIII